MYIPLCKLKQHWEFPSPVGLDFTLSMQGVHSNPSEGAKVPYATWYDQINKQFFK